MALLGATWAVLMVQIPTNSTLARRKTWLNDVKCLYSLYVAEMMLNFEATRQKKGLVGELDTPSKK